MKITVVGAGAIGGVIGATLVSRGRIAELVDVVQDHVDAINTNGLKLLSKDGTIVAAARAYTPQALLEKAEKLQCVLLCVKAQHTKDALLPLLSLFDEQTVVVSVQNGLCELEIAELIGRSRTIGGFVNIFADYLEPGVISYGGKGALYIGELDGNVTPRLKLLKAELSVLDRIEVSENIFGFLWSKLAYGAILTATALTNETMADVFADPRYRMMLMDVAGEILSVAAASKIEPIEFDDWNPADAFPIEGRNIEKMNRQLDVHVSRLRGYSKVHSGIWRDIAIRKRKTEKSYHFGPIYKVAEQVGIDLPLCRLLMKLLIEVESGERMFSVENLDILLAKDQEVYGAR